MTESISESVLTEVNPMNNKKIAVISAVSGILSAVPYIFKDISLLIFISLTPVMYCVINFKKYAFPAMFFYFFAFYFFSDLWILSIGLNFISNRIWGFLLSAFIILSVSLLLAFTASLPFVLLKIIKNGNPFFMIIVIPFIYILGEWIHGTYPLNFPWNRLCNITAYNTEFIQSASIFGGLFISYIIVLINVLIAYSFKYFINGNPISLMFALFSVLIYGSNIFLGELAYSHYNSQPENEAREVVLVQANFSKNEKRKFSSDYILDKYIELAQKNITKRTELVVFSETSLSRSFFTDNSYKEKLYNFSEKMNVSILFGVSYNLNGKVYNSCAVLYPDKTISEIYMKRRLVPFGEYTPSIFPQNIHFINTNYCQSEQNVIIDSNIGKIGCAICYESIFPFLAADNSRKNAELLAILTNDSWLGKTVPLYQHHGNSILRAVENRKYTITCANTGISSIISSDGKIIRASMPNVRQTISADICCNKIKTFYAENGDIIIIPSLLIVFIFTIIYFAHKEKT